MSDALVGYRKSREFREQQEGLTTAAQDARRLADIRYQGGATSYLEVLDADTRLFDAELGLAQARALASSPPSSSSIARWAAAGSRRAGPASRSSAALPCRSFLLAGAGSSPPPGRGETAQGPIDAVARRASPSTSVMALVIAVPIALDGCPWAAGRAVCSVA